MNFEFNNAIRNDAMYIEHHCNIIVTFLMNVRTYDVLLTLDVKF